MKRLCCLLALGLAACGGPVRRDVCAALMPATQEAAATEQFVQSSHWDGVTRLAFSASGRYLASGGDDRTIRIWNLAARRAVRIFRVDGELDDLGWDGDDRLMVSRRGERPVILDVAGARALAALADWTRPTPLDRPGPARWIGLSSKQHYQEAVALFGADGAKLAYPIPAPCAQVGGAELTALATSGALLALCDSGTSQTWLFWSHDGDGWKSKVLTAPVPRDVATAAVAADGQLGVVVDQGGREPPHGLVATPAGVQPLGFPLAGNAIGLWLAPDASLGVVLTRPAFYDDPDAATAASAAEPMLAAFDPHTRQALWRRSWPEAEVMAGSPDGRLLAVGDELGRLELVDAQSGRTVGRLGSRIRPALGVTFDHDSVRVREAALEVEWSLTGAELTARKRLEMPSHAEAQARLDAFLARRHGRNAEPPVDPDLAWAQARVKDATAVVRSAGRGYVGTENGDLVVLVGDREVARGPSDGLAVSALVLAPDGHRLASISADGMVRIWDADRAFVRGLLVDFDDDEWMVATPRGAYTGTPEVGERIGWVFEAPLEFFGFEQFAGRFRDPALVRRRLAGEEVEADLKVGRPPRVSVLAAPASVTGTTARVRVAVSSERRVETVRAYVEGRLVGTRAVCAPHGEVSFDLPLPGGVSQLAFVAFDDRGYASNEARTQIVSQRGQRSAVWVVAVGVSHYPHLLDEITLPDAKRARLRQKLELPAARADAEALAHAFADAPGFSRAHVTTLLDADATPAHIRAALAGLADMGPDDIAIVSLAGHGFKAAGDDMEFVTGDARLLPGGKQIDPASHATIGWGDLAAALAHARGRVLVLLDACHAGHVSQELLVPNDSLARGLAESGRAGAIVFAAAKGRQYSFEPGTARSLELEGAPRREQLVGGDRHGYFTGALLAALRDPVTDRNHDGVVEVSELIEEVSERVSNASGGLQTPWVVRRDLFGDFAVAPLAAPKRPHGSAPTPRPGN